MSFGAVTAPLHAPLGRYSFFLRIYCINRIRSSPRHNYSKLVVQNLTTRSNVIVQNFDADARSNLGDVNVETGVKRLIRFHSASLATVVASRASVRTHCVRSVMGQQPVVLPFIHFKTEGYHPNPSPNQTSQVVSFTANHPRPASPS